MSSSLRRFGLRVAVSFVLVAASAVVSPVLAAEQNAPSAPDASADSPQIRAGTKREQQRSERRDGADAKQERRASRDRYRGSSRADAIALGRRFFPEGFSTPLFDGEQMAPGLDLVGYRGTDTAIAKKPDGTKLLLQSTLPLRARSANGVLAPVDLSLRQSATTFTTANSSADLQISQDADKGAALLSADLAFAPQTATTFTTANSSADLQISQDADKGAALLSADLAFAPQTATDDVVGTKTADRVFYSETQTDTDFIVSPTPTGMEFSWLLRSADAPERLVVNVDLPAGAVIRRAVSENPIPGDPPKSLEIANGTDVLAYVRPPLVYDADGVAVPAEMTVQGRDKIVLTAKHRDRDVRYPLYADPSSTSKATSTTPGMAGRTRRLRPTDIPVSTTTAFAAATAPTTAPART